MDILSVRSWKPIALRGAVALAFGVVALLWPSITLSALVLVFGMYALADGLLAFAAARQRSGVHVWPFVIEGLIGLGVAGAAFVSTRATTVALVSLIATWSLLTGIVEIALALRLRRQVPGEFMLAIAGSVAIVLGVLMLVWPVMTAFVIVTVLGLYAVFFGAALVALALRLRRIVEITEHVAMPRYRDAT